MPSNESEVRSTAETVGPRQPWEPIKLHDVGEVTELVQTAVGGGKSTAITGDPGEPQKVSPQG